MPTFKDANGREWVVKLDAPTIADVRSELSIDLIDPKGASFLTLSDDPVSLVNVLWVICREQAQRAGLTDRQFGEALVGDPIEAAAGALCSAICDFFPQQRRRLMQLMAARQKQMTEAGWRLMMDRLESADLEQQATQAMEEAIDRQMQSLLSRLHSATN